MLIKDGSSLDSESKKRNQCKSGCHRWEHDRVHCIICDLKRTGIYVVKSLLGRQTILIHEDVRPVRWENHSSWRVFTSIKNEVIGIIGDLFSSDDHFQRSATVFSIVDNTKMIISVNIRLKDKPVLAIILYWVVEIVLDRDISRCNAGTIHAIQIGVTSREDVDHWHIPVICGCRLARLSFKTIVAHLGSIFVGFRCILDVEGDYIGVRNWSL